MHLCFGHESESTFKDLKREIAPFTFNTTNKNHPMFITDWPIVSKISRNYLEQFLG